MKKGIFLFTLAALLTVLMLTAIGCKGNAIGQNTIRVVIFDRGTDGGKTNPTNNKWVEWIQKKLLEDEGINIIFIPVPRATEEQAQINLMAAGNPPDICMTYDINSINNMAAQGGLFDMSPYIDTHLKDLKEFFGEDPTIPGRDFILRNMNAKTGEVFSITSKRMNTARLNTFIRKDWLDKLGLPVPRTTQQFFDALIAFRDRNPGRVDRVIPYSMTKDVRWGAGNILESFINWTTPAKDRWINTVADRFFLLPGYKEGARFMNRMYNAGLIDPDFPLYQNDEPMANKIKSGNVGSFGHNWDQIFRDSERLFSDLLKNVPDAEWVAMNLAGTDGTIRKISYDPAGINVFIPKASKNPILAMRYLNWLSKFENYNYLQIGQEGISHELIDGIPRLIPNATDGWIQNSSMNIDYTPIMNGLFLATHEESIRALANAYPWPAERILDAYNMAMENARPNPVIITSTPLEAAGPVAPTLVTKSDEFMNNSIRASAATFDRVWDTAITDWLNTGARAIIEEREAKYIAP
ncbi:MAG: extracellular solute-binding protein [Treponema sp.]|nr:extracellular solute-binding protein [Treponema sp.]